jgi:predicted ester cyclase
MSEERKAKIKKVWEEAFNEGNIERLDELYNPKNVTHRNPFPDSVGLESLKQYVTGSRATYSDIQLTIDEVIEEEDRTATLWTFEAKHTGVSPVTGRPPTNKRVKFRGLTMAYWEGGKIVEEKLFGDYLGCFEQLGYVEKIW